MIKHIVSLAAIVAALTATTAGVLAGEPRPFTQEAFTMAKAEGKTVLVDFHASWCPVCKKQAAVIPRVLQEEKFREVVVFTADYDTELRAPPFDTTGYTGMWLRFTANYQNHADADYLDVDVSTDGGATWTNVMSWNEDHGAFRSPPGEDVELDIMAVTGNQPSVIVRWHYYNPNTSPDWDWYVQIDNAALLCGIPVELMGISVE